MKFSYFKFPLSVKSDFFGDFIYKPIIPIELKFKNNSINYLALIDSGADLSIIDAEAGEYLGIDVKNGKEEYFGVGSALVVPQSSGDREAPGLRREKDVQKHYMLFKLRARFEHALAVLGV